MKKATDALLADHKMIRRLLTDFHIDNPRYAQISTTLLRVVRSHAWFEDTIFIPAFRAEPRLAAAYLDELTTEHAHIEHLLRLLGDPAPGAAAGQPALALQFRAILTTHLQKEEDALFPLAETILDNEGLNRLGAEMERRQDEPRRLFST